MNKDIKLQHMCVDDIAPLNVGSPKINRPYAKLMGTLAIVITQGFLFGGGGGHSASELFPYLW